MPWTAADAPAHTKKAKTDAQKKKWASIANSVLKDCQAKGGKDCEGKAIRIANSSLSYEGGVKMSAKEQSVPKGALRFVEHGTACAFAEEDGKPVKMKMTAYTGGIIKGHWWWGDLAIDTAGMSFKGSKFPILENHMTDKKIAFTGKPILENYALMIDPETTKFVDTEESREFQKLSAEGFPYQASIYAVPQEVQRLAENEVAEVNGFKMKGPGTVWRKCQFKEASVCVFGWDSKTQASAFSREEKEIIDYDEIQSLEGGETTDQTTLSTDQNNDKGGETIMDLAQLKKDHPDLVTELFNEVRTELETKFSKEREGFETQIKDSNVRLAELEKKDALRDEAARQQLADKIFDAKLSNSALGTHLHDKVKKMIDYTKFVKDNTFDTEAFSKAVDEEIDDWTKKLGNQTVLGMGGTQRSVDDDGTPPQDQEENKKLSNMLLGRAGQSVA